LLPLRVVHKTDQATVYALSPAAVGGGAATKTTD
jgi:hypothetical protein